MALFKNVGFEDRKNAAEAAKKNKLEKFRALTVQIDQGATDRLAARSKVIAARKIRDTKRESARQAKAALELAEQLTKEATLKAEQAAREVEAVEQAKRDLALAAEQKAARDARYAARKARK